MLDPQRTSANCRFSQNAILASEQESLESAMLEDKLRATDWESTEDAIQEQVARESYLCWLRDQQQRHQQTSPTAASTATASCSAKQAPSPPPFEERSFGETEEQILARVLRESQLEYVSKCCVLLHTDCIAHFHSNCFVAPSRYLESLRTQRALSQSPTRRRSHSPPASTSTKSKPSRH